MLFNMEPPVRAMTQTTTVKSTGNKGGTFLRAMGDLFILGLLLAGAGAGGYFWGTHQQLAPVEKVGPGTPGAIAAAGSTLPPPKSDSAVVKKDAQTNGKSVKTSEQSTASEETSAGARKFWISSSGADYTGYSITVKVNDNAVDNFFGPGKNVDITRLVKNGANSVAFEAKELGEQYNKHTGDAQSILTLQVVSGPHVTDSYKKQDVLLNYSRTAAQTEDASSTQTFTKE